MLELDFEFHLMYDINDSVIQFGSGVGGSQVIRKRRRNGTPGAVSGASANTGAADDLLVKMWDNMRANNGIMVLLKLLMVKTPITEADAIRALACKVGSLTIFDYVVMYDKTAFYCTSKFRVCRHWLDWFGVRL